MGVHSFVRPLARSPTPYCPGVGPSPRSAQAVFCKCSELRNGRTAGASSPALPAPLGQSGCRWVRLPSQPAVAWELKGGTTGRPGRSQAWPSRRERRLATLPGRDSGRRARAVNIGDAPRP